jgi:hypothetical protein
MTTTPVPEPDTPPAVEAEPLPDSSASIPDAKPACFPGTNEWRPDDN